MSKVSIKNMEYSIAVEVSGFQDKVLFLQVYKGDISGSVNTNKIYNRPIFVEPLSKYNERNHVVFPNEVAYNPKNQTLNVKYADGYIEQFEFKL